MDMFKLAEQMAKANIGNMKSLDVNGIRQSVKIEPKISIPKPRLVMPNPLSNSVTKLNSLSGASEMSNNLTSSQMLSSNKIPNWVWWVGGITLAGTAIYIGIREYKKYKEKSTPEKEEKQSA